MTKLTYDFYLLYKYNLFDIVGLQTNNILIFTNNTFVAIEKIVIKITKFKTKKRAYFLPKLPIKFNNI